MIPKENLLRRQHHFWDGVIGADGSLTGYAEGLEIKEYLLELEQF